MKYGWWCDMKECRKTAQKIQSRFSSADAFTKVLGAAGAGTRVTTARSFCVLPFATGRSAPPPHLPYALPCENSPVICSLGPDTRRHKCVRAHACIITRIHTHTHTHAHTHTHTHTHTRIHACLLTVTSLRLLAATLACLVGGSVGLQVCVRR